MTLWLGGLNGRNGMCQVFNSPQQKSQEILFKLLQMFRLCSLMVINGDRSEIRRSPVDPAIPRWLFGSSSINSMMKYVEGVAPKRWGHNLMFTH